MRTGLVSDLLGFRAVRAATRSGELCRRHLWRELAPALEVLEQAQDGGAHVRSQLVGAAQSSCGDGSAMASSRLFCARQKAHARDT